MSRQTRLGLVIIGMLLLPFLLIPLLTYEVIKINVPTNMADTMSIGYQEAPRLKAAENAVSTKGESIVSDSIPVNPIPADDVSLQRGEILFSLHCALCHGVSGAGDGPMVEFYENVPPPDITGSNIGFQLDGAIYRTISKGFGNMPTLSENLTPRERWDVINYLRTLEIKE